MLTFSTRCLPSRHRMLLALLLVLLVPGAPLASLVASGSEPRAGLLLSNQPAYFHVPAGASTTLEFDARMGSGVEIFIEVSAPGAHLVVLAPDGRPIVSATGEQLEWLVVAFPVSRSGRYRLVANQESAPDGNHGVSLRADSLQFAFTTRNAARVRAASLFSAAKSLARSPDSNSLQRGIEAYRRAAAIWSSQQDREGQMIALAGEARAWLNLSEYGHALAALNHARLLSRGNAFFTAWLANVEAQIYLDRWDSERALSSAQEALRLSLGLKDEWLRAEALAGRGEAEYLTGDPGAQPDIDEALRLSRESDAGGALARALRCKAWMEGDEGRVARALAFMGQAERQFRAVGQIRNAVDAMANLATIQGMGGDRYAALTRHSRIMPLIRESGKQADLAFLQVNIANDYMGLNRVPDAIAYYRQAIVTFRRIGLLSGESVGVSQLCIAEARADRLHQAARDCSTSMAIAEQLHDPKRLAITIWRFGTVQRDLGQKEQAMESFKRAYRMSEKVHDTRSEAQSLMDWGDVLESLSRQQEAQRLFQRSLLLSAEAEDSPEQVEARYRIARAEFEAGQDASAERNLNIALESAEVQRRAIGNPDLQASYFAQVRKCHELLTELLMRRYERDPSSNAAAKALEVSESGRALTLLGALAERNQSSAETQPVRQSQELLALQIAVDRAYDQRLKIMVEGGHRRDLDDNESELIQAIDSLERAEDANSGMGSAPQAGRPLSAQEIVAADRSPDLTLVEYELGSNHSYVWVIQGGRIESHVLPARQDIEAAVREWRGLTTARLSRPGESFDQYRTRLHAADKNLPKIAGRLSCMLLGAFLQPAMQRLAIVPDGELDLLSFAALPEDGCHGNGPPLMVNHPVLLTPSLSVLLTPRDVDKRHSFLKEVALFADPVFDGNDPRVTRTADSRGRNHTAEFGIALPRLAGTREEAEAIVAIAGPNQSALYLDFDASLQTLLSIPLNNYRILHLATHGLLDESEPGLSGLVFSLVNRQGQPVFGYLKRHDIEKLSLRSDLVVLSSCDSGEGASLSGEGVVGLNRAFLSAGARSVLSALWAVDDEASRDLMIDFYNGMLHDGLDAADALRRSQIKLMHNPATSEPYFWAGFTITTTAI